MVRHWCGGTGNKGSSKGTGSEKRSLKSDLVRKCSSDKKHKKKMWKKEDKVSSLWPAGRHYRRRYDGDKGESPRDGGG